MIDITDQIVDICREVVGKAYRTWPQKSPKDPYAVVSKIGHMVEQADRDGSEVRVRLTYSVSVLAPKPSEAQDLTMLIGDRLAAINFHTTGYSDTYEEPNHLYRANVTVDGAVDRRGDTFF